MQSKRIPTESIVSSDEAVLSRQRDLSESAKDNIRSRIASAVQSASIPDNNLTKDEQQALKGLKNDAYRQITQRIILQPDFTQSHDYKNFDETSATSL